MNRILGYFSKRFLPRWLVLLFDLSIILIAWIFAIMLRFDFSPPQVAENMNLNHLILIYPVFLVSFLKTRTYAGILRRSTSKDILQIIVSVTIAAALLFILSFAFRLSEVLNAFVIPYSVIIIMCLITTILLSFSRLMAKLIFSTLLADSGKTVHVMIFGAGNLGEITKQALLMDSSSNYKLIGFIDDSPSLQNKTVSGAPIYSPKTAFEKIIPKNGVKEIIIAINSGNISRQRLWEITDICQQLDIVVKEVPHFSYWLDRKLKVQDIKNIKIEDLLGRETIHLNTDKIENGLKGSVVLVTGAAGSIGSEIVRQLIAFGVKKVLLFDKAESGLYDLQQEIVLEKSNADFEVFVGDVTNPASVRKVFEKYAPSIVFNAAAYKHVPLMEEFPNEAFHVNVGGTKILADLSIEFGVEKFVFISTDKAVNPTNVMGATKRISEIYIQSLACLEDISTKFITTRFGNVLGSNGSVVPLFKKQIEKGGPVTVTHKEITRYFMTIPEACQLVLEAGFMGDGGEIFVFDMGEPVRIYDMAKKMISLAGLTPGKDIDIKITKLRPGEKLFEELMDEKEGMMPTHNKKIMIGKMRMYDYNKVNNQILSILNTINEIENDQLVDELMRFVPEYISKNSLYSKQPNKLKKSHLA